MKHYDIVVIQTPLTCSASCGRKCNSNKSIKKKKRLRALSCLPETLFPKKTPKTNKQTKNSTKQNKKKGDVRAGNFSVWGIHCPHWTGGISSPSFHLPVLLFLFFSPRNSECFSYFLSVAASPALSLCIPGLLTNPDRGHYLPAILIVKSSLCSIISLPPVAAVGLYCSRLKFSLELKNRAISPLLSCFL